MSPTPDRLPLYEDLMQRVSSALRAAQLYAPDHPVATRSVTQVHDLATRLFHTDATITVGLVGDQVIAGDMPLAKASSRLTDVVRRLRSIGVERLTLDRGLTHEELGQFVAALAALAPVKGTATPELPAFPHARAGRLSMNPQSGGELDREIAEVRHLYRDAVSIAELVWESAALEGRPELTAARDVVDRLAQAIVENRPALLGLTAMKRYDNYTFTHMVNVSILTMSQARGLGVDGRLLEDLGLAGLMHDIGKVRTPKEILNKPDRLTDAEFEVMRRHPVEGAEMLRGIPEMPSIVPVVAFEHHLRRDGSGYPPVRRPSLNLATALCSIADVFDAMRGDRTYQQGRPTDRILSIMQFEDGHQFDRHLVRRFVQLVGVYPPGTLVRLSTGAVAVVVATHAPDPFRPAVRVLYDEDGDRLLTPVDRNLWEPDETDDVGAILAPLDPDDYPLDPLTYV